MGTVVSGTCLQGMISLNDTLLMGPNSLGEFLPVAIRGIHRKRLPVKEVKGGQTASFALKKVSHCDHVHYTGECIFFGNPILLTT